jgi:uncharacterized 2Fe-2S/4Fe-4S cluster protein (DUF4445 family)
MRVLAGPGGAAAPAPTPEDARILGPGELAEGWRLGCRHRAEPGMAVQLPPPVRRAMGPGALPAAQAPAAQAPAAPAASPAPQASAALALAVDLGTTTVHWAALDPSQDGAEVASGAFLNPQMGAGSEVMSRLAFAQAHGADGLRRPVLDRLRAVVAELAAARGAAVRELCVAGNPAMVHLLLGLPVDALAHAPYGLATRGGDVGALPDLPPVYAAPLLAPFVGGDLSAGLAWALRGDEPPKFPFLLADMGTNGEFVLALSEDEIWCASVALGPALEGIGLTFGAVAGAGAVASFGLAPTGLFARLVEEGGAASCAPGATCAPGAPPASCACPSCAPGPQAPSGPAPTAITGAGYLSLVAALLRAGVLDERGAFRAADDPALPPLARRLAAQVREAAGERRLALPGGLYLTGADVEEILKVKAACNVAFVRLLEAAGAAPTDLAEVLLAGALGAHAVPEDLAALGFFPPGLARRVRVVGNASLAGARLLLHRPELRAPLEGAARAARVVELAGDAAFNRRFIDAMVFTHVQ